MNQREPSNEFRRDSDIRDLKSHPDHESEISKINEIRFVALLAGKIQAGAMPAVLVRILGPVVGMGVVHCENGVNQKPGVDDRESCQTDVFAQLGSRGPLGRPEQERDCKQAGAGADEHKAEYYRSARVLELCGQDGEFCVRENDSNPREQNRCGGKGIPRKDDLQRNPMQAHGCHENDHANSEGDSHSAVCIKVQDKFFHRRLAGIKKSVYGRFFAERRGSKLKGVVETRVECDETLHYVCKNQGLLLSFTCTGVSFSNGSNGMGLIMLSLIGILPAVYALDLDTSSQALKNLEIAVQPVTDILDKYAKDRPATADEAKDELSSFLKTTGHLSDKTFGAIAVEIQNLQSKLQGKSKFSDVPKEQRSDLRTAIYLVHSSITKLRKQHLITDKTDDAALGLFASGLKSTSVGQS